MIKLKITFISLLIFSFALSSISYAQLNEDKLGAWYTYF